MKTLIVGGGLSGLAVANSLETQGLDYMLVEARSRFGGRIKTERIGAGYFDMGPAWFWPNQPRIAALIDRLGLEKFDQFSGGILTVEDEKGQVQRGRGYASMEGSWRLTGGLGALTDALASKIPDTRKRLNAPINSLKKTKERVTATLDNGEEILADQVILALPPRVADKIEFNPPLPTNATKAMQGIPTWMAGQAKAVAVYDTPFWRDAGLSGDAMSRHGPMVEIHDASPATGGPYALFGFIGVPAQNRSDEQALRHHILAQLGRLFGDQAVAPTSLFLKDWAFDPFTSTQADLAPLYTHPTYGMPQALRGLWDDTLHFAGTEVAPEFGGFIEGALEAAENVLKTMQN
jgi:monoamine oxidase